MAVGLLDLPNEILSQICNSFRPPKLAYPCHRNGHKTDNESLKSISLTCWGLRAIAIPLIFRFVTSQRMEEPCLVRLLISRPLIARCVREVRFGGRGCQRPLIITSRQDDQAVVDEHIRNDPAPKQGLNSASAGSEPVDILQHGNSGYISYALSLMPNIEMILFDAPLAHPLPGWDGLQLLKLHQVGGYHDSAVISINDLAAILRSAPSLTYINASSAAAIAEDGGDGAIMDIQSRSLNKLKLRDTFWGAGQLEHILHGLPNLAYFEFQHDPITDVSGMYPCDVSNALAVRADSLAVVVLDLEQFYVDEGSMPPPGSLKMSFKDMPILQDLEIYGNNAIYGLEMRGDPEYHIDFEALLPPQIESFMLNLQELEATSFYVPDLRRLAQLAPTKFPKLKLVACSRLLYEDYHSLIGFYNSAGIDLYSADTC